MGIVINLPKRTDQDDLRGGRSRYGLKRPEQDDHWTDAWRPGLVRILAAQCEKGSAATEAEGATGL